MIEELLPGTVAVVPQVEMNERITPRFGRLLNQNHMSLLGRAAPFLDIARRTGTDNIAPGRSAPHAPGNDMIERKLTGGEALATILAPVAVTREDVATIKLHLVARQPIVEQQANDARHRNIEPHRGDPVMAVWLELTPELAGLAPTLEIVVGVDLGDLAAERGRACARPSRSRSALHRCPGEDRQW